MITVEPSNTYEVDVPEEDIETLSSAYEILYDLKSTMKKLNCSDLEGGYGDCPIMFSQYRLSEVCEFLEDFIHKSPHTMY